MQTYIITFTDPRRGQTYLEKLSFFGFPYETNEKAKAYQYTNKDTAYRHANIFNINLRFAYKQNGVPEDAQTFCKVETLNK